MKYVVVDLECTCHLNQPELDKDRDIIEIASSVVEESGQGASQLSLDIYGQREFCRWVKPKKHPKLSAFCTELTGITQDNIDFAPELQTVLDTWYDLQFKNILNPWSEKLILVSWGEFDRNILERDWCGLSSYPFDAHLNLKTSFARYQGSRPKGLSRAINSIGWEFEGIPHRASWDVWNTLRILRLLIKEHPQHLIIDWNRK